MIQPPNGLAWRQGQAKFLSWFEQQTKPYVVAELPTGFGKSPIAVAVGRLEESNPAAILVGTKALQEQYQKEHPEIPLAKGRGNYECRLTGDATCEDAPCTFDQKCEYKPRKVGDFWDKNGCSYYDAKIDALEAPVSLHNYAYFLTETLGGGSQFARQYGVLILDEADTVEGHVRQASTLEMRWRLVTNWEGCPQYPISQNPRMWNEWAGAASRFVNGLLEEVQFSTPPTPDEVRLKQRLNQLERSAFIISQTWPHMMVTREEYGWKLQPVVAGKLAMDRLLKYGGRVLAMSGTIGDPYMFAHQLGIPPEQMTVYRAASSFPPEIRPITYWPVAKMGHKDNEIKEMVSAVDRLLEQHPNSSGVIHTVSVKRAAEVRSLSAYKDRLIVHGYSTNPLAEYVHAAKSGANKVLVSPSVGRGTDFAYDLARFQIIIKVPYPDLSDPVTKARTEMPDGWRWYNDAAARSLVQMSGRIVRAEDDYGETFILTKEMDGLFQKTRKSFPAWWLEAVRRIG